MCGLRLRQFRKTSGQSKSSKAIALLVALLICKYEQVLASSDCCQVGTPLCFACQSSSAARQRCAGARPKELSH